MTDLLPCPFCGLPPSIRQAPFDLPYIECPTPECGVFCLTIASMPLPDQIAAWNRRPLAAKLETEALDRAEAVGAQWGEGVINRAELRAGLAAALGLTPRGPGTILIGSYCRVPQPMVRADPESRWHDRVTAYAKAGGEVFPPMPPEEYPESGWDLWFETWDEVRRELPNATMLTWHYLLRQRMAPPQ